MLTSSGDDVAGMSISYMFHTAVSRNQTNDIEWALDIIKAKPFLSSSPYASNLTGYTLCISSIQHGLVNSCLLDGMCRLRMATYDVTTHACDRGKLINV
jgi:hypothetical protein